MSKYYEKIPLIVRNCIRGIDNPQRLSILIYLIEKKDVKFHDLSKVVKIGIVPLRVQLGILMRYGLIYMYYSENKFYSKYLHYQPSKLGIKFIKCFEGFV